MLALQDDIYVLRIKDYIRHPKPSGYRSLHMIVEVPIFLSKEKRYMRVEVQLRTIAMDFWASLEHQLRYKSDQETTQRLRMRLQKCAETSAMLDQEMQNIYREINGTGYIEKNACVEADFQA
jgi:putative GTP pyrophosphokinase